MNQTKQLGNAGEALAAEYLLSHGYKILTKNFRVNFGEMDIIALEDDCICFVEVKTRRSCEAPQEAVSWIKQRKLTRVAQSYLKKQYDSVDIRSRFDVVAIEELESGERRIDLIKNAFDAC